MKHQNKSVAVLTKWVFETNADTDSPGIISTGDVAAGEEPGDSLDSYVGPYLDTIDDLDVGSLDRLWEGDGFAHQADCLGAWIVERSEGTRKELGLFDPDAPSIERIARSYRLQRMPPLFLL